MPLCHNHPWWRDTLNTGTAVEVFPMAGGEPLRGTLFFKVKGQIAHCICRCQQGQISFCGSCIAASEEILNGEISEQHPQALPLPKDWYGYGHTKVKN